MCLRFGHDHDPDCMAMDESLYSVSEKVQNFCVIYLGTSVVHLFFPGFVGLEVELTNSGHHRSTGFQQSAFAPGRQAGANRQMYELYDPCTCMFFYRSVLLTLTQLYTVHTKEMLIKQE